MVKTRTEVFIETKEIFLVRRKRHFLRTWCPGCGRHASHASLQEATLLTGHDASIIMALIEKKTIHLSKPRADGPMVCLRSLCLV